MTSTRSPSSSRRERLWARILPALQDFDLAVLDREAHVAREQIIQSRAQKLEAPAVAKAAPLGMIDVLGKIVARCDHAVATPD